MNKEDFVTYEQALALKKLGFNERCLYYYNANEQIVANERDYQEEVSVKDLYISYNSEYTSYNRIDAPTLAQAQKWFRQKGYSIEAMLCVNKTYRCDIFSIEDFRHVSFKIMDMTSYEEALSAGITECLKLLEK